MDSIPQTILVVEDDDALRQLIAFVLEDQKYRVVVASNGREGLERIERQMPDLILLDMKMPVMDGWEFAEQFRTKFRNRAPLVVMTAAENARSRAAEIDANGWISKPFGLEEMLKTVRDSLHRKRAAA